MVAANRSAMYIRELDVFGKKLGFNRGSSLYEVASSTSFAASLDSLFLDKEAHVASESVAVRWSRVIRKKRKSINHGLFDFGVRSGHTAGKVQ